MALSDFSLKRLRLLAEYGRFEQNAYWHRRLAKVYRDAAYVNAAIKEFNISIKMDGQDWAAMQGMAYCYEKRKDYTPAIECIPGVKVGSAYASPCLVLGLWYRLHGKEQEAKLCFQPHILDGIDTLTDDDPENDMFGYMTLAITLLKAGDRRNAGAAFAVTIAPLDRLKDVRRARQKLSDNNETFKDRVSLPSTDAANSFESLTSAPEKSKTKDPEDTSRVANNDADQNAVAPDDDKVDIDSAELNVQVKESDGLVTGFPWSCDGRCRRPVEDWQEIHFCEICSNYTCFCDECIKLVKTGTLPFRKCDESHTFYQGYSMSKEMQDIATVTTEGKILPRTEWLEALKKEWVA